MCRRRFDLYAKALPVGGSKEVIINRIYEEDIHFIQTQHLALPDANQKLVADIHDHSVYRSEDVLGDDIIGKKITPSLLRHLGTGRAIPPDIIEIYCELLSNFDRSCYEAFRDVNSSGKFYTERRCSIFRYLLPDVIIADGSQRFVESFCNSWLQCHRVYLFMEGPGRHGERSWILFVVDVSVKKLFWFHPQFHAVGDMPDVVSAFGARVSLFMLEVLQLLQPDNSVWPFVLYAVPGLSGSGGYQLLENDFDSGVYVITACNYLLRDVPPIFQEEDMRLFRQKICYDILRNAVESVALA